MITSTKNSRVIAARKLTQRKHRLQQNRFLVEGLQSLSIAIQQPPDRVQPLEIFYCEDLFTGETAPRLLAQLIDRGARTTPLAPNVMNSLSERDNSQGLAVTFSMSQLEWAINELTLPMPDQLPISPLLLILDKLQDPGNLGTLIRTADAAGINAVILFEPCVDPFDPKTVRSSMGSIFSVPIARTTSSSGLLPRLAEMGYNLTGADAVKGQPVWQSGLLNGAVALILGNEARGLSPDLHQYINHYVSLPMYGHAESLNVSIAGGSLIYEWLRINRRE